MSTLLRQKRQERRDYLVNELMRYGYFKTPVGKQLYELNLSELEQIHINVKCRFGKEMTREGK
ncbi:Fur-regulated basic protein FbpA [Sutcliffiella sp. NC1]|uniref:Fur-regulated basic protein FbpA n=1 Tax=Sutcliffiella sp. NC1 TaxID=3004096 RepID=UPI0022DDBCFE|nr:Fur-regulated basic protein FbpA [Sutcliffiella sp. NC1]WBL16419.1 Fur-regulated basic protein FbpA [Sutcliffiella sp. NC1]